MRCSQIRDELEKRDCDEIWSEYIKWVETLIVFWKRAIVTISQKIDFDEAKRDKHLLVVENSLSLMNDWRFGRIKYVKARRNEIDSAISFIKNNALNKKVSKFLFAPVCRNVASVLRSALYLSTHGYSNEQLPTVVSQDIFRLAQIYLYFPFHDSDFICFLSSEKFIHTEDKNDLDNYHIMLENAGKNLEIEEMITKINKKAKWIWQNFKSPQKWQISDEIWNMKIENLSAKLYYQNMKEFHGR